MDVWIYLKLLPNTEDVKLFVFAKGENLEKFLVEDVLEALDGITQQFPRRTYTKERAKMQELLATDTEAAADYAADFAERELLWFCGFEHKDVLDLPLDDDPHSTH